MVLLFFTSALAQSIGFQAAVEEALDAGPLAAIADAERRAALGTAITTGTPLANPEAELEFEVDETRAALRLPLPIAGQPIARIAAGDALRDAAKRNGEVARIDAALVAGRAYLDAERADQLARLAAETLAVAERSRDGARRLLEAREISIVDAVTLEALAARAVQDATTAQQDALRARVALEVELGRTPSGELRTAGWPDLAEPPGVDPNALPRVSVARDQARAARAQATLSRMNLLPTPTVIGGWSETDSGTGPIVGVALELPILAPGAGTVRTATAQADRAVAVARQAELEAAASWVTVRAEIDAAAAAWSASRIEGLEDALGAIGDALESGEYSLAEYVARRDAILDGLVTAIDTRHRLEVARLALWALAGRLPTESGP